MMSFLIIGAVLSLGNEETLLLTYAIESDTAYTCPRVVLFMSQFYPL